MKHSHTHHLYIHCIWTTLNRLPLISPEVEPHLYKSILAKCADLKTEIMAIGGVEDHVHILARLNPQVSISHLMKEIKGSSSHFANHELNHDDLFKWQRGYAAFSVSKDKVEKITTYIKNQKSHHASKQIDISLEAV